jgi:hypothetical protein
MLTPLSAYRLAGCHGRLSSPGKQRVNRQRLIGYCHKARRFDACETVPENMRREFKMKSRFRGASLTAALGFVMLQAQGQPPSPSADPYAHNPDAGKMQFPLAAPAGKDSGAITKAPPDAVNQGMLDPAKWKYGPAFDASPNSKIWNPMMIKMMKG